MAEFNIESIIIDGEFQTILDDMEGYDNMFITGNAGTGKSTLLKYFLETTDKNVVVVAPTGIAAVNVGGQTIHSFFKFGIGPINVNSIKYNKWIAPVMNRMDTLIIDEISMVRCDMLDAIDMSLRVNRNDMVTPFGGVQVIMIGDLAQLPPVVATPTEKLYIKNKYKSRYFFDSMVLQESGIKTHKLTKVHRQKDANFVKFLDRVRTGNINEKVVAWFNAVCYGRERDKDGVYVCMTNAIADRMNEQGMKSLPGKPVIYETKIKGDFSLKGTKFKEQLTLKEGARVMMIKNDPDGRWYNGTMGTIAKLYDDNKLEVDIDGDIYDLGYDTWDKYKYNLNTVTDEIEKTLVGSISAFPLIPAWAITAHKSQGCTFEKCHINFGTGTFEHGQAYVALSRCTTLKGLTLENKLQLRDVLVDRVVVDFLNNS